LLLSHVISLLFLLVFLFDVRVRHGGDKAPVLQWGRLVDDVGMAGAAGGLNDWDRAIAADFQKHSTIFISGDGWRIVEFSKDFGGQQR